MFGALGAAWPLIRDDLRLDYAGLAVVIGLPNLVSGAIEPAFGILADTGKRRILILAGGLAYFVALALLVSAAAFGQLFAAALLLAPASGAFVGLAQVALVDREPAGEERSMARWVLVGSLGAVTGPLVLSGVLHLGGSWRLVFLGLAAVALVLVFAAGCVPSPVDSGGIRTGLRHALTALREPGVLRWLGLLEISDLLGDVLLSYLALYFTDVAGASPALASLAVATLTAAGLIGDVLVVGIVARVSGLRYLRFSSLAAGLLFLVFLLVPGPGLKLAVAAVLGVAKAGWYAILKGRLYAAMPDRRGTARAIGDAGGMAGSLLPLGVGLVAGAVGLGPAFWTMLLAPLALLVLVPGDDERPTRKR